MADGSTQGSRNRPLPQDAYYITEGANGKRCILWDDLSPPARELFEAINLHRLQHGLEWISYSPCMAYVAQAHAEDVETVLHHTFPHGCNAHSWSGLHVGSRVDYYPDHRNSEGMWVKPEELTQYHGNGYEIACSSSAPFRGDWARRAMTGWQSSPGHYEVIMNRGTWDESWKALGVGLSTKFVCAWFGREEDCMG